VKSWVIEHAPDFEGLKRAEWKPLQDLAQRTGDSVLQFWTAALGDDRRLREEALGRMTATDFHRSLELLVKPIAPISFVAPQHIATLMGAAQMQTVIHTMDDEHFVDLVKAIIAAGGARYLDNFAGRIEHMEGRELASLEKELPKASGAAEGFLQAVITRREELGPQVGLIQRLTGLPKLLSNKQASSSPAEETRADNNLT
jgi:hypothetical protein